MSTNRPQVQSPPSTAEPESLNGQAKAPGDGFFRDLERRERDLTDFIENAVVALHWVGEDGTILWANKAELQLLGYAREEYVGHNITELFSAMRCCRHQLTRSLARLFHLLLGSYSLFGFIVSIDPRIRSSSELISGAMEARGSSPMRPRTRGLPTNWQAA